MEQGKTSRLQSCDGLNSRNWYAWLNAMPPTPDDLHVIGEVEMRTQCDIPILVYKHPQGINPAILQLELKVIKENGPCAEVLTWKTVRYDQYGTLPTYTHVEIFCGVNQIALVPVEIVW